MTGSNTDFVFNTQAGRFARNDQANVIVSSGVFHDNLKFGVQMGRDFLSPFEIHGFFTATNTSFGADIFPFNNDNDIDIGAEALGGQSTLYNNDSGFSANVSCLSGPCN